MFKFCFAVILFFAFSTFAQSPDSIKIDPKGSLIYAVNQPGSTADAKITAAIAALPSIGGTVDASGLIGSQSWAACPRWGSAPVTLITGVGITIVDVDCTIPANVTWKPVRGSLRDVGPGATVRDYSAWDAPWNQTIIASGVNVASTHGNMVGLGKKVHAGWFGADPTGKLDSAPAVNAAEIFAATNGASSVTFEHGTYLLSSSNYQVVLPQDDGGYGTPVGGRGAKFRTTISGNQVSGCIVTDGGSGYTHSDTMLLLFSWPPNTNLGSGVTGTATTNSSGVFTNCTITNPGVHVVLAPTVTLSPHGGDGATLATTLRRGSITPPTVVTGGNGFPASTANIEAGVTGVSCATYPSISVTSNALGAIASVQQQSLGSGCTGTPVAVVGHSSCGGAQCTNLAPETSNVLNCSVKLWHNMLLEGDGKQGTTLLGTWNSSTVDNGQTVMFCDPNEQGGGWDVSFKKISFSSAFIDIYVSGMLAYATLEDVSFYSSGIPLVASVGDGNNYFRNIRNDTGQGFVCGGFWTTRYTSSAYEPGGYCDKQHVDGYTWQGPNPSLYVGSLQQSLDRWFETFIWKSQNGQSAGTAVTNYGEAKTFPNGRCYITNALHLRAEDQTYGHPYNSNTVGSEMCYRGIAGWAWVMQNRNARLSGAVTLRNVVMSNPMRGILNAALADGLIETSGVENGGLSNDPYLPPGTAQQPAPIYLQVGFNPSKSAIQIRDVGVYGNWAKPLAVLQGSNDLTMSDWVPYSGITGNNAIGVTNVETTFPKVAATITKGENVASATCLVAVCDANRGSIQIVGGRATTGTIVTVGFHLSNPPSWCSVSDNGSSTHIGWGKGTITNFALPITAAVSVAGLNLRVDYECRP